jgi:TetR/AcrR family transcriptional regulator, transcriptional repressor for nem operon
MSKGEETREVILERAAELFNVKGFAGASMSDIMEATGLQKGGIYNHFASKEDLALEAFDFAFNRIKQHMVDAIRGKRAPLERLYAIVQFFEEYIEEPPVRGGCIILNTAIESDDSNPALRMRARHAMDEWRELIQRTVTRGINQEVMRPELDPDEVATIIIGMVEGAMVLRKLYEDGIHIRRAIDHIMRYIDTEIKR